jgi:hypothetical protein
MGAISAEVALAPPEPDAPGLFRCAARDSVAAIFREAGLHDVAESDVRGTFDLDSGDDYWTLITDVTAPVVAVLAGVDDATGDRIRAATIEKAQAFQKDGKSSLPFHARCIVGTK